MEETWKKIPNLEVYEVSNLANVRRIFDNGHRIKPIYPSFVNKMPYLMFTACYLGKTKKLYLHRCVAEAFVPNPDPTKYNTVCFVDGNKYNALPSNLYWSNQKERMGRRNIEGGYSGMDGSKKLTPDDVREIRRMHAAKEMTGRKMAQKYGVHSWTIWCVTSGRTWQHIK